MRGNRHLRKIHSSVYTLRQQINDLRSTKPPLDEQLSVVSYPSKKEFGRKRKQSNNLSHPPADIETIRLNKHITNLMRSGQCEVALDVFESIPRRSIVSYNVMISGYLSNGRFDLAREMFDKMPVRDLFTWNVMLSGCVRNKNLAAARELFDKMPERDVVSWNSMLSGYAKNGCVVEAREIFDRMPVKNSVSWNGLLSAYVQNGMIEDAKELFESKRDWDIVSWNCLMGGFVKKNRLDDARWLFDRIPSRDEVSWNTMISGYAQNGELEEARRLFEECPTRDVYTWTTLLSGYVQHNMVDEARSIFARMPEKSTVSWNAMISGYVQCKDMEMAEELFKAMPIRNVSSWNTIITGYSETGNIADARRLFDRMPMRDAISWSAMIAGYVHNNCFEEAINLLVVMRRVGERLSRSSFSCALTACAKIAALDTGRQLHGWLFKVGLQSGCYVGNALIAMYYKCGNIGEAHSAFEEISCKDVISWNSMIYGYARHGFGKEALAVFELMKKMDVKPDDATMVGVLSACSHTGLLDKGTEIFYSMHQEYGISPKPEHYTCMVDLLGRAGRLEEAHDLLKNMPFEADATTWGALLGASRTHGNAELGENAAEIVFEKEPNNTGMYVLLSNLYAASGRWRDVSKMRLKMRDQGMKKEPGCSWLEVQSKVHSFTAGDCLHPEKDKIDAYLEEVYLKMRREGYSPSTKLVLQDVEEEEKVNMIKHHSEKLAVAYGILSTPKWRPIRVIKNLRICEDCHNVMKYISKIEGRLIIVRDSNRFHHFEGGSCSCGDYW